MWKLYDDLLRPIPKDKIVDEIIVGIHWTMVRIGEKIGVAATNSLESIPRRENQDKSWYAVASLIKSWNFLEAGIGMAAINAFYNNQEQLNHMTLLPSEDIFLLHQQAFESKKVAIIGHFKFTEKYIKNNKNTFILERETREGDYPDSACEYILPGMDYVFITGCTLVNKTLPRLLDLSKNAKIIMAGPSVPAASALFQYGVSEIGSTIFEKEDGVKALILQGQGKVMAKEGKTICIKKKEDEV
ncbi:MAG: DUF364 domain-containing protein [Acetivibrio sp.]